ncbi:transcriptional regulator [Methyloceanibacter superfactus]|uniref:Transcriptional regulator n=1 Tax=Methyloceanibacter superfactus TaxID=1774969 RepID=A0A1E3W1C2_9HYPH|nr:LysR family transcriptional regulator [Methyloceanibacter superfactus]ODR99605.1 transcriptional regulator [Methyloceanibacter superfactus]
MEMHQVRYFLAVARALNFTRAAEECNVAQPSLTRAIRQLEGELGGDLFRRERPHAQLTELGERMLPLLKQCYDSALSARSLASAIKKGEVGSLRLALSRSIDPALVTPHVVELGKLFSGLELKLLRGSSAEVLEYLKSGEVELAIAGPVDEEWDRLDSWPLFTESFHLAVSSDHALAKTAAVALDDLRHERLMLRTYCESTETLLDLLRGQEFDVGRFHEVSAEADLLSLLEAGFGVAFVPNSAPNPATLTRISVAGVDLERTICLYGVAGRQRTAVASSMMKMLRAYDWTRLDA